MLVRRDLFLLCGLLALATACGARAAAPSAPEGTVDGVGVLPGQPTTTDLTGAPAPSAAVTTTTLSFENQIGSYVQGNRVIIIGDSIFAATSARYTNDMCDALVPLGWQVELDAESGRPIEFGNTVLDARLAAGFDAGVVLLGSNYNGNQEQYRSQLERIVERLTPRPVVLLTVTEFEPSRAEVNAVIREMADLHDNVVIVDWATTSVEDPTVLANDGLHLTNPGRAVLAANVALALGPAPKQPGKCLTTNFEDDSLGAVTGSATTTTTTVKKPGATAATTTTVKPRKPPATTTTTPHTSPTTTAPPPTTPPEVTVPITV